MKNGSDLESLSNQIAVLSAQIQSATYELLTLIREFDEREGWGGGFTSCAHWLCWRIGLSPGAAREKVRTATALGQLPRIGAAMQRGEVSYSKVRALTRVATPENEEELLHFARAATAAHVESLVRGWRLADQQAELNEANRLHLSRSLELWTDADGMVVVRARLEPEAGAALKRALEAASDALYEATETEDLTTAEQRRADALQLVAESALSANLDGGTRGDRYQVVVHVDAAVLAEPDSPGTSRLDDGDRVSAEMSRRLACDSSVVAMTHAPNGAVLDVGRRRRTLHPALRRALHHRDHHCQFPACQNRFCEAHHVRHWAAGGETKLENLVLLCRRHHRAVHEEGVRVEATAEGRMTFRRPDGSRVGEVAPLPRLQTSGARAIRNRLQANGLDMNPETCTPTWNGDSFDLAWAVQVLRDSGRSQSGDVPAGTSSR